MREEKREMAEIDLIKNEKSGGFFFKSIGYPPYVNVLFYEEHSIHYTTNISQIISIIFRFYSSQQIQFNKVVGIRSSTSNHVNCLTVNEVQAAL